MYSKQVQGPQQQLELWAFGKELVKHKPHMRTVTVLGKTEAADVTEQCAIPDYWAARKFELPVAMKTTFSCIIKSK